MAQNQPDRGQRGLPGGSPRYSAFAIAKKAMNYHQDWQRAWRDPEPKSEYDAVIIGGGGHGLQLLIISQLCMEYPISQ